jgi:hypothetical protein
MAPNNPVTIRHNVSSRLLADIIEIAQHDAIDAWADIVATMMTEDPAMYKMEIIEITGDVPDSKDHHTITGATILLGMQRIIDLELPDPDPRNKITTLSQIRAWIITSITDGDATMIDDYCADAIIQYGIFGEQVYN